MVIDFNTMKTLYLANSEVEELYINGSKVWEKGGSTPTPLTFTAEEANSTVAMATVGSSAPSVSLEYSTDDGRSWNTFTVGSTTVTLANIGDEVCFRAGSGGNTAIATSTRNYNRFVLTGSLAVKGNIMSLLDQTMTTTTLTQNATFASLFWNGRSGGTDTTPLVDASELELPANTLTRECYANLFRATRITTAPDLPATTLAQSCYDGMFRDNRYLTTGPDVLPATATVGQYTYASMFNGCSSLTKAPVIKATTLTTRCFDYMFSGCSSLNEIEIAYTGNFSNGLSSFNNWVNGVSSTGTLYYNGSDTTTGTSAIPTGWTVQTF